MKGTVTLNNGKSNGGTWRHPALDLALNQQEGGATATRFYQKFPIYRPRGAGPPDVKDDVQKIWDKQISLNPEDRCPKKETMFNTMSGTGRSSDKNAFNYQTRNDQLP